MVDCDTSFQNAYSLHLVVSTAKRYKKQMEQAVDSTLCRLFWLIYDKKAKVMVANAISYL
jgi:hypothetical protein